MSVTELRQPGAEVGAAERDPVTGYRPLPGVRDEMMDAQGQVRPAWARLLAGLAAMPAEARRVARDSALRLMRENGAAFNVYADPEDRAHRWRLRTVPWLLDEVEWQTIEAGVLQRAEVLDRAIGDLHGPATLLRDGIVPPALVFGDEHFVRAVVEPGVTRSRSLALYACDLARDARGNWVVLADQTEAPSGIGYALANRVAMTHGFADLFHECGTQRLVGFFTGLQESLVAGIGRADGRIVVLGPEPGDPGYFGHAYLARYLGYTLAETGDLTVRDERLYLKTLDGLQRVDLLLRQVPAGGIDPLELPGPGLGVPGLIRASRQGNLQIVNAVGSGIAHNRALAPFMTALTRRFADADPILADAPCLWLGDPAVHGEVLGPASTWHIGRATARNDPGEAAPVIDPRRLDARGRAEIRTTLEREGYRWAAQSEVALATTPVWENDRLVPMPFALRVFAAATPNGWEVMPGALVRFSGTPATVGLPNGFGAGDLWVLTQPRAVRQGSLLQPSLASAHLRRTGRDLLSRTADNLFWLGRYTERADGLMRLIRSVLARLVEDSRLGNEPPLLAKLLGIVLTKADLPAPVLDPNLPVAAIERDIAKILYEPGLAYAMRETLDHVQRTATLVRDQISHDAWRTLVSLFTDRAWRQRPDGRIGAATLDLLDSGLDQLTAFVGTEAENMTRNFAWRFLEMGRRLERAIHLLDLLRGLVPARAGQDTGTLPVLLELADSSMTYRSRYLTRPLVLPTLDLLLLDETNPRGVAFQLAALSEHIDALRDPALPARRTPEQQLALRLLTDLRLVVIDDLADGEAASAALDALVDGLATGLPELSDLIGRAYFAHIESTMTGGSFRKGVLA